MNIEFTSSDVNLEKPLSYDSDKNLIKYFARKKVNGTQWGAYAYYSPATQSIVHITDAFKVRPVSTGQIQWKEL